MWVPLFIQLHGSVGTGKSGLVAEVFGFNRRLNNSRSTAQHMPRQINHGSSPLIPDRGALIRPLVVTWWLSLPFPPQRVHMVFSPHKNPSMRLEDNGFELHPLRLPRPQIPPFLLYYVPRSRPAQHSSSLLKPDVPAVRLYGPESCPISSCLRLALLYKSVPFQFVPQSPLLGLPFLQCGADTVVGAAETLLRELDSRFPRPPAAATALADTTSAAEEVALVTALQHRSVERHVEELARWVTATAAGGGGGKGEAARMERSYGQLAEVVLEHAQMEERLLFPAFESAADRGTPSSPVRFPKITGEKINFFVFWTNRST
ncbi:hypothetical protein B296_00023923 [Ensete ventricosum]|uniref:Hemerythrin-like domain-containing protein n=1 Tax=Ensete ventricosum TaxID=4639 RepID=A0A427AS86_ENSVE|nr:hypothetical protein B296_00023923 [Ensete ventricosum]